MMKSLSRQPFLRGVLILPENKKARLFLTYLKGKSELLLYVKPWGTYGSRMIYRRSPGDAAMNLRIQSLIDQAGVLRSEVDIWIMLYPPEILTSTLYTPKELTRYDLHEQIKEHIWTNLPYSFNYDHKNYITRIQTSGDGMNMVTVTILGKSVLPRVKALLYKSFSKVSFIGDGLQFLQVDEHRFPHTHGRSYQVILPYDEIFFLAGFRSGIHISSCALTHANSGSFGRYKIEHQQAYLDCRQNGTSIDWPQIMPIVPSAEWREELLTPAAFPAWFVGKQSLSAGLTTSFLDADRHSESQSHPSGDILGRNYGYLD